MTRAKKSSLMNAAGLTKQEPCTLVKKLYTGLLILTVTYKDTCTQTCANKKTRANTQMQTG